MKKIASLFILLVLLYSGYHYIDALIRFEKLSNRIDLIISEPQSKSLESIQESIITEAAKLGIPLSQNDIEITISDTEMKGLGERFIARPEIDVESKLLTVSFIYPVKILIIVKDFTYHRQKVFTSRTSLVDPYDELFTQ